ncbi:MAG TPA: transcriptional regulator [Flavobacteriaceae bacterium]|nr:transcriptional regulator [Flavobacteriaceae bacterium]MAY52133.1 transcriptional regulator [Flavobacteriaceae bacterium]HBR55230.1 transcriptional regulator [Flavobacteriaceae bacterium]HIB47170.1 Rrf2 family transcriptional regulator [Flavobacteriaceae bacterium]
MFSKACEYGIRSLIFIAMKSNEGKRVNISAISKQIDGPEAFTAKVLQQLVRGGVIKSIKGPHGGFEITSESMETTTLADIVAIIDGPKIYSGCGLGLNDCNEEKPCPLHFQFAEVRNGLKTMLENTTLQTLAFDLEAGTSFLKH